jgi:hypothetical protein
MARFFPDAQLVAQARQQFARASYGEVHRALDAGGLGWPHADDLPQVLSEFSLLADKFGLADHDAAFIVLVSVRVNGARLTTPILVDVQRNELAFTSHPTLGAGVIPGSVLAENSDLAAGVREGLLGVLATWQNHVTTPADLQ